MTIVKKYCSVYCEFLPLQKGYSSKSMVKSYVSTKYCNKNLSKNEKFLPTAYVVRGKVMFWHVSVHPSVCPQGRTPPGQAEGVPEPGPAGGEGGYLRQVQTGGVPQPGLMEVPCSGLMGGVTWGGVPLTWSGPIGGYPSQVRWGVPKVGYPLAGMGYPPSRPGWVPPLDRQGITSRGTPQAAGTPPPPTAGGIPPLQDNRWSTWYAAVGMPLAFTQEDFLVA